MEEDSKVLLRGLYLEALGEARVHVIRTASRAEGEGSGRGRGRGR